MLMYDEVVVPDGKLWKRFGPLHVYAPPRSTFLPSKSLLDVTKTLLIVLYCSRKHEFARASKHNRCREIPVAKRTKKYAESIEHALRWLFEGKRG